MTASPRPISGTTHVRVRYEETDRAGVVYHANYFRYFEMGRTELMRALGTPYRRLEEEGTLLTVVAADARFRRPARYDDLLAVETRLIELTGARIRFAYEITNADTTELLCTGSTLLGSLNAASGRPVPLPDSLRSLRTE